MRLPTTDGTVTYGVAATTAGFCVLDMQSSTSVYAVGPFTRGRRGGVPSGCGWRKYNRKARSPSTMEAGPFQQFVIRRQTLLAVGVVGDDGRGVDDVLGDEPHLQLVLGQHPGGDQIVGAQVVILIGFLAQRARLFDDDLMRLE